VPLATLCLLSVKLASERLPLPGNRCHRQLCGNCCVSSHGRNVTTAQRTAPCTRTWLERRSSSRMACCTPGWLALRPAGRARRGDPSGTAQLPYAPPLSLLSTWLSAAGRCSSPSSGPAMRNPSHHQLTSTNTCSLSAQAQQTDEAADGMRAHASAQAPSEVCGRPGTSCVSSAPQLCCPPCQPARPPLLNLTASHSHPRRWLRVRTRPGSHVCYALLTTRRRRARQPHACKQHRRVRTQARWGAARRRRSARQHHGRLLALSHRDRSSHGAHVAVQVARARQRAGRVLAWLAALGLIHARDCLRSEWCILARCPRRARPCTSSALCFPHKPDITHLHWRILVNRRVAGAMCAWCRRARQAQAARSWEVCAGRTTADKGSPSAFVATPVASKPSAGPSAGLGWHPRSRPRDSRSPARLHRARNWKFRRAPDARCAATLHCVAMCSPR